MTQTYTTVTELPGSGATSEQLAMLYARYALAAGFSRGKDVAEVACGPGIGLGYLARYAHRVVGGDLDETLLHSACAHYGDRVPLLRLDAQALPFADRSFDVVILFEALYYLRDPERFLDETRRVLRPGGTLLISTVNREWPGFNPSPLSHRYLSAPELRALLATRRFTTELYGGFVAQAAAPRDRLVSAARRIAVGLHLIPPTMKGKERLKRLIFGRLSPLPHELDDGMAPPSPLVPLGTDAPTSTFKVLYAVGRAL
jgi:SAM-dependent methyltransferase